ncbi:MAG TPA: cupredoxin domain-containing protein [Anaeromyxobacter sp.]
MRILTLAAALAIGAPGLACREAPPGERGPVRITVTKNGYEPFRVQATRGRPLTLVLTRTTDETCATEIVIPDAGITRDLPLGQPVTITFTPERTGELRYSCAMRMFQGIIDVR